jgi:hypothetical protein
MTIIRIKKIGFIPYQTGKLYSNILQDIKYIYIRSNIKNVCGSVCKFMTIIRIKKIGSMPAVCIFLVVYLLDP